MPKLPYRVVRSRLIHRGRRVALYRDELVHRDRPKQVLTREMVRHPGAVVVIPFKSRNEIVLVKQFRYAAEGDLWEVPAGTLEPGEKPLPCAKRELEEETGYRAAEWARLTSFLPAPGISDELMTLYAARRLKTGKKNPDEDEWLEVRAFTLKEAEKMVKRGVIRDAKTIVAVLWALRFS